MVQHSPSVATCTPHARLVHINVEIVDMNEAGTGGIGKDNATDMNEGRGGHVGDLDNLDVNETGMGDGEAFRHCAHVGARGASGPGPPPASIPDPPRCAAPAEAQVRRRAEGRARRPRAASRPASAG